MKDYKEARDYVNVAGTRGSVLGLDNIINLMNKLDNVQDKLNVVHVAGTNGKGSTSAYISQILIEAGYKVGKYSSPAVFDYLEIFSINNKKISEDEYTYFVEKIKRAIDCMEKEGENLPTAFEIETALAFLYFYEQKCDVVVLETGLGGLLDATNIIKQSVSVITSISMDHNRFLGDSLEEIAFNKAGIIKENCSVISSIQVGEVKRMLLERAKNKNADIVFSKSVVSNSFEKDKTRIAYISETSEKYMVETQMLGTFQQFNVATAIETALCLKKKGLNICRESIEAGIKNAKMPGRCEKINDEPLMYIDGGHNPGAALNLYDTIEIYFTNKKLVYIIGVLADKDYEKVLSYTASLADEIITVTPPDNVRALDGRELLKTAEKYNSSVQYAESLDEAVRIGKELAGKEGVLFIFGSLSYLGKIKKIIQGSQN